MKNKDDVFFWDSALTYSEGCEAKYNGVVFKALAISVGLAPPHDGFWTISEDYENQTMRELRALIEKNETDNRYKQDVGILSRLAKLRAAGYPGDL